MTRTLLHIATAAALATVALAGCKKNQDDTAAAPPAATPEPAVTTPEPAATPAPAPATPATSGATVTSAQLGSSVGADMKVSAARTTFAPGDTIYVSVDTRADAAGTTPGKLTARWTYEDGQVVNEESRDLQLSGDGTTEFHISKPDGFPTGKYKVEVSLDGNVVQTKEFEVR